MKLKATLTAEGDFLSSTAQLDTNNKHFLAFLCHQKRHMWWSPLEGCLMQWCHHSPLWAAKSQKVTISRWMAQLLNWWAQERSELHLGFPFCAALGSEEVPGDRGFQCRILWSSAEQVYGRKPIIGTGCSSFWVIFRTRHEDHPEQVHSQWRISPSLTAKSPLPWDRAGLSIMHQLHPFCAQTGLFLPLPFTQSQLCQNYCWIRMKFVPFTLKKRSMLWWVE